MFIEAQVRPEQELVVIEAVLCSGVISKRGQVEGVDAHRVQPCTQVLRVSDSTALLLGPRPLVAKDMLREERAIVHTPRSIHC